MIRAAFLLLLTAGTAMAQSSPLAPTGTLRAALNFGNPVLVQRGPDGQPRGVTPALAKELAARLGVPLTIVPFEQAGKVTDALAQDAWDICFLAVDPVRGQGIAFTDPYVTIEGVYVIRKGDPYPDPASVDAPGIRVAVVRGSAYDLYLSRTLKSAELVRFDGNDAAVQAFLSGQTPILAGVRQPLEALLAANPNLAMIPGRFMSIEQAMGTPRTRGDKAAAALKAFVADVTTSGFVARALE